MSDAVKPALTAAQWETAKLQLAGKMVGGRYPGRVVNDLPVGHKHAAAALALYEQPFGFTYADLDALDLAMLAVRAYHSGSEGDYLALESISLRIAALLPREGG